MFQVNMLTNATKVDYKMVQLWRGKVQSHQGQKRASSCPGVYIGTAYKTCLKLGSDKSREGKAQMDAEHKSPRDPINGCKEQRGR